MGAFKPWKKGDALIPETGKHAKLTIIIEILIVCRKKEKEVKESSILLFLTFSLL
jgi:hypothetical protein